MSLGAKQAKFSQYTPPDVQGLRGGQLGLLNGILSNGAGSQQFQNIFGNLGNPATALQRQSTNGISQYLNQPAPEQRAFDISLPAIQNILAGKPGQGIIDALQPSFQKNLAQANQAGGRFSSGNMALRGNAVNDFNLLAAQAAQQGQQTQLQAAQQLGLLGQAAGQNPFQRLQGAFGIGAQEAGQNDLQTQRQLAVLMQLLGAGQQTALNGPVVQTQQASGGLGGFLGGLLGTGLGALTGGVGSALGGQLGSYIGRKF